MLFSLVSFSSNYFFCFRLFYFLPFIIRVIIIYLLFLILQLLFFFIIDFISIFCLTSFITYFLSQFCFLILFSSLFLYLQFIRWGFFFTFLFNHFSLVDLLIIFLYQCLNVLKMFSWLPCGLTNLPAFPFYLIFEDSLSCLSSTYNFLDNIQILFFSHLVCR